MAETKTEGGMRMKNRKVYTMAFMNVLLAASLVTTACVFNSQASEKDAEIEELNATLDTSYGVIRNQAMSIAENSHLKSQNNDLTYESNVLREKLEAAKKKHAEDLHKQEMEYKSKIQKLSAPKPQPTKLSVVPASTSPGGETFKATYYDAGKKSTGKSPGHPQYGITFSGRKVETGVTIAVDPKVIPIGSWVQITHPDGTVEKRRADDTGGAIKGHKIDIYVPDVTGYGTHPVQVKILSTPSKS